ncbi:MAG: molybdenum cofactor guanylyltransferase MobA [Gammaproteobacteria bacterium]
MVNHPATPSTISAVVLAGGRATRMEGEDKGLIQLAGRPLVAYVIDALYPQVGAIFINANRNQDRYAQFGYPVIADEIPGYCGPLAGIASGMQAAETEYIITSPCDSPFLPSDLVQRLANKMPQTGAEICVAHDGSRIQPVFSLISCALLPALRTYLNTGGRKVDTWYATRSMVEVDFSDAPDTFLNLNTMHELALVEARLGGKERPSPRDHTEKGL